MTESYIHILHAWPITPFAWLPGSSCVVAYTQGAASPERQGSPTSKQLNVSAATVSTSSRAQEPATLSDIVGGPGRSRRFSVSVFGEGDLSQAIGTVDAAEDQLDDEGAPEFITVTSPAGMSAGELLLVTCPDGREVEVTIPEGVLGGDEFEVFVGELDEDAVAEEQEGEVM